MYLGWDWASQRHDVTVIDDTGQLVDRWTLAPTEAGIHQAMTRLAGHGRPDDLPVAIEATSGIVVDRLLAAGHPVVPTRPNSFNAARPRWGASKATSDPGDSFKLAEDLRTDGHRLRRRQSTDAATGHLQASSRLPTDHLEAKTTATMKLSALLAAHWPGAKALVARLDSDIALEVLERYRTPQTAQRLGEAHLAGFLGRHGSSGRRTQPSCFTGCGPPRSQSTNSIPRSRVDSHPHPGPAAGRPAWQPRRPGPGPGRRPGRASQGHGPPAAGSHRPAQPGPGCWPRSARSWTGPVTSPGRCRGWRHPGHHPVRQQRRSPAPLGSQHPCPQRPGHRRRQQPPRLSVGSPPVPASPPARQASPQAIRILLRTWPRVIWACWHTGRPYDINHHRAAQPLAQQPPAQG
jgi:hypothetical protein